MTREHKTRVLVLTERFHPEPNFITAEVAERLGRDAEVTVIAPHPSYPRGRFYEGIRYWRPVKTRELGCTVWRVPFFPDQSLSKVRRAMSYLSFALVAGILGPIIAPRSEVVWVYHGPFATGLAALWFKLVRRARLVITAADLWPESMTAAGVARPGLLVQLMFAYSRWINRFADHIICANDGIARRYRRDGIPAERLTVLPVWIPGVQHLTPAPASRNGGSFDVIYAGNLGPCQQLETLIRGAALLKTTAPQVQVHLYGSGSSEAELRALSNDLDATNVRFHGRVSLDEAFRRSSEAAVQVVSLRRSPEFRSTVPSKLSLMFAAGAPFVYGLEGDAAEVAEQSRGGVPFDQGDPASVATAIQTLSAMSDDERRAMRARLREYYQTRFSPLVILEEYARILLGAEQIRTAPASAG